MCPQLHVITAITLISRQLLPWRGREGEGEKEGGGGRGEKERERERPSELKERES